MAASDQREGAKLETYRPEQITAQAMRVGVDLVQVADVADSIELHGDRYLRRVYSEAELTTCRSADGSMQPARLAARFAAKEAVIKALRPTIGVDYRNIEVVLDHAGGPSMVMRGAGGEMLRTSGVVSDSVSLTHDGAYASAVYVAVTQGPHATDINAPGGPS